MSLGLRPPFGTGSLDTPRDPRRLFQDALTRVSASKKRNGGPVGVGRRARSRRAGEAGRAWRPSPNGADARWRGAKRAQDAHCWAVQPPVQPIPDLQHLRRTIRYVLLNPCRAGLVDDPLAWPLSTHRDHVGLGDPALAVRDPEGFHAWVSGDPSVSVTGTRLPALELGAPLQALEDAVGAVLRLTPAEVRASAEGRALALRAAAMSEYTDAKALAAWMGVCESLVHRRLKNLPPRRSLSREPLLAAVLRVAGDPRFGPLVLPPRATPTRADGWRLRPVEKSRA